jgi:hypothetical protein
MNIVNEQITHILYGNGKIINQEGNILSVQFADEHGIKSFIYPDAFEKFLKLSNSDIEILVQKDLNDKQAQVEEEKLQIQKKYAEAAEKKAMSKLKSSSTKKKFSSSKSTISKKKI